MSFKYQIGDVLCHAAAVKPFIQEVPARLFVVETLQNTCYAGVAGQQNNYKVRVVVGDGNFRNEYFHVVEAEVVPYPSKKELAEAVGYMGDCFKNELLGKRDQ